VYANKMRYMLGRKRYKKFAKYIKLNVKKNADIQEKYKKMKQSEYINLTMDEKKKFNKILILT
jgi:hypothetical protein